MSSSVAMKIRRGLVKSGRLAKDVAAFDGCERILDVGCGRGDFLAACDGRGVGLDGSADNIATCAGRSLQAQEISLPDKMPFSDDSFDGVYLSHLVEHFSPPEASMVLSEIDRVLAPGGVLVIRSPLMSAEFFDDPTHVRPYHLHSVLHMLGGWEAGGTRQSVMGRERPRYRVESYYEEIYPLYVSKVSPTISPRRFPIRLALRGAAHGLARVHLGRKGAYGALLRKEAA